MPTENRLNCCATEKGHSQKAERQAPYLHGSDEIDPLTFHGYYDHSIEIEKGRGWATHGGRCSSVKHFGSRRYTSL
jgi:hypothetical protein